MMIAMTELRCHGVAFAIASPLRASVDTTKPRPNMVLNMVLNILPNGVLMVREVNLAFAQQMHATLTSLQTHVSQ